MSDAADVIEAQVVAYRDRDLEGFLSCYAADATVTDGEGNIVMNGIDELREQYGKSFLANPVVTIEIAKRIAVGEYVVDEEHLGNLGDPPGHGHITAAVAYRVSGGLITRAILLGRAGSSS